MFRRVGSTTGFVNNYWTKRLKKVNYMGSKRHSIQIILARVSYGYPVLDSQPSLKLLLHWHLSALLRIRTTYTSHPGCTEVVHNRGPVATTESKKIQDGESKKIHRASIRGEGI